MLCLSMILLRYRITCLWFCNKRFYNKKGPLFVPDLIFNPLILLWNSHSFPFKRIKGKLHPNSYFLFVSSLSRFTQSPLRAGIFLGLWLKTEVILDCIPRMFSENVIDNYLQFNVLPCCTTKVDVISPSSSPSLGIWPILVHKR